LPLGQPESAELAAPFVPSDFMPAPLEQPQEAIAGAMEKKHATLPIQFFM
jgi:hypothetical protein